MGQPNENGVYEPEAVYEVARRGRAYVRAAVALCADGRHRAAITMQFSYGGQCSPITGNGEGFASAEAAKVAALSQFLTRFPVGSTDPISVQNELRRLREQVELAVRQPLLL